MRDTDVGTKALRARELGVSLRSLYYKPKKPDKDWALKVKIEEVLREHPSYGSRRLALHLHMNRKKVKRVMNIFGIMISRSAPGCPWENGYQESFYDKFEVDFGDPSRFKTLGELVLAIYQQIWQYNNTRIHSVLKMAPVQFALQAAATYNAGNKDAMQ